MTTTTKKRTKRRGNGEGSIYQRGGGRWVGNITLGYDGAGKRNRRVVYGWTKGEVQTELTRLQTRRVELPQTAVTALHEHRKRMVAEGNAGVPWVFRNSLGGPLRRSHFHRQDFKPLLKRAGLPDIRFHDLRHSHATLLLSQGVHPKVVQERLGHSQISVTMDTYSHLLPTMQREAAGQLDRLLVAANAARA
jgi:integrase